MRQKWVSEDECDLAGTRIRFANADFKTNLTTYDEMVVLKPRRYFESYAALPIQNVKRILEVGIFEGGSAVLLADMFPDAEIIGIDIRKPNPAVLHHIDRLGYSDRIKLFYEVSQGDRDRLEAIIGEAWGANPIDLVVDDASHVYGLSTQTFDIAFPRVREGGLYIIEDWGWAHWAGFSGELLNSGRTLSSMVLELVMGTASHSAAVREVTVNGGFAAVRKGPGNPPPFSQMVRLNGNLKWSGL